MGKMSFVRTVSVPKKGRYCYSHLPGYLEVEHIEKANGDQIDKDPYLLTWSGTHWICNCKGFHFHGYCCHEKYAPWKKPAIKGNGYNLSRMEEDIAAVPKAKVPELIRKWERSKAREHCSPPCISCEFMTDAGCTKWMTFYKRVKI